MGLKVNKRKKLTRCKFFPKEKGTGSVKSLTSHGGDTDYDYGIMGGDYGDSWRSGKTYNAAGYNYKPHPKHHGDKPIKVGKFEVYAGAMRDLTADDMDNFDVIVPLTQDIPNMTFGHPYRILAAPLVDYGGVPETWEIFLKELVIPLLEGGHKMLAYCFGSHGRTGCFLASLISILEPETEDPIAAARERHCKKAVESKAQANAVFALRGQELPKKYDKAFESRSYAGYYGNGYSGSSNWGNYGGGVTKPVAELPKAATGVVGKSIHEVAKMNDDEWTQYAKDNNIPIFD